eukprot:344853-Amphidinium_carterae.1
MSHALNLSALLQQLAVSLLCCALVIEKNLVQQQVPARKPSHDLGTWHDRHPIELEGMPMIASALFGLECAPPIQSMSLGSLQTVTCTSTGVCSSTLDSWLVTSPGSIGNSAYWKVIRLDALVVVLLDCFKRGLSEQLNTHQNFATVVAYDPWARAQALLNTWSGALIVVAVCLEVECAHEPLAQHQERGWHARLGTLPLTLN